MGVKNSYIQRSSNAYDDLPDYSLCDIQFFIYCYELYRADDLIKLDERLDHLLAATRLFIVSRDSCGMSASTSSL